MLCQVIYSSRAAKTLSMAELQAILEDARAGNERREVTGALIYTDGTFLQVLEGSKEAVLGLMNSIVADTRHSDVKVIHEADVDHRVFGRWTMAYLEASPEQLSDWLELPGGSSIGEITDELSRDTTRASAIAGALLRALAP